VDGIAAPRRKAEGSRMIVDPLLLGAQPPPPDIIVPLSIDGSILVLFGLALIFLLLFGDYVWGKADDDFY